MAVAMISLWQYTKYAHGHGFFRLFSYGGIALAVCVVAMVVFVAIAVLREK